MRWVIRMKREANPALVDAALEKTGDLPIVEQAPAGTVWGTRPEGENLVGQNVLGRLWMELRQQIRDGDPRALAAAWENPISPQTAEHNTWQRIKTDYASLYRASGDRLHHIPYQEGFNELRDLVAGVVADGGCPAEHQGRLKALHGTLQIQDGCRNAVLDARTRLDNACAHLTDLKEKMDAEPGQTIETMPAIPPGSAIGDASIENWRELALDPAHNSHMQIAVPDMLAPRDRRALE